jgi:hypothetical protein
MQETSDDVARSGTGDMNKMAILLSTNKWNKMDIFQAFLAKNPRAVWRIRGGYTAEWLAGIPHHLNLYFFHRNIVGYRANCTGISSATQMDWPLSLIPPEFITDVTPYNIFIVIDRLEKIDDIHIKRFPKWEKPEERFQQGQLGLLRVRDILAG